MLFRSLWRARPAWLFPEIAGPRASATADARAALLLRLLPLVAGYQLLVLCWEDALADGMIRALSLGRLLACLLSLELLRRKRLRAAALLFVSLNLLLTAVAYGYWGMHAQLQGQVLQLLPVLLAGALLGRRALWLAAGSLCLMLALGAWLDAAAGFYYPARLEGITRELILAGTQLLMVVFVLDQSVALLRHSLRLAQRHGAELVLKRDQLQLEMQEKEQSREQLVHALKMENVGRLASGVAHDFNHLLTLILGYAGKAQRSDDPVKLKAALQGAESAARRAAAVTRRLLDFSRQEQARPQWLDAAGSIASMEPMLRQLLGSTVELELDTGLVDCSIHFDPAQLELVLLSLAANASQAMPDGGRFRLALSCPEPGGQLLVQASDSGHGMSEEVRRRCLEPFFTTKLSGQGTGLGLAVADNLIQAAGGRIVVDSAPGEGSCFQLWLPTRQGGMNQSQ